MTDDQLTEILQKHDSVISGEMLIKDVLSAMRECYLKGLEEGAHDLSVFNAATGGEFGKTAMREAMRLDSIGFIDWASRNDYECAGVLDDERHWQNQEGHAITTGSLYNEYLEYLKTFK